MHSGIKVVCNDSYLFCDKLVVYDTTQTNPIVGPVCTCNWEWKYNPIYKQDKYERLLAKCRTSDSFFSEFQSKWNWFKSIEGMSENSNMLAYSVTKSPTEKINEYYLYHHKLII